MSNQRELQVLRRYEGRAVVIGAIIGFGLVVIAGPLPIGDWWQSSWKWLKLALGAGFIGALIGALLFRILLAAQLFGCGWPRSQEYPGKHEAPHDDGCSGAGDD